MTTEENGSQDFRPNVWNRNYHLTCQPDRIVTRRNYYDVITIFVASNNVIHITAAAAHCCTMIITSHHAQSQQFPTMLHNHNSKLCQSRLPHNSHDCAFHCYSGSSTGKKSNTTSSCNSNNNKKSKARARGINRHHNRPHTSITPISN